MDVCPEVIANWIDTSLSSASIDAYWLMKHIESCPICQEAIEEMNKRMMKKNEEEIEE